MHVSQEVLSVLSNASIINDNLLKLPEGQLERKLYAATNKVIEAAGGKWNRKIGGHAFGDGGAEALLDQILLTGQITNRKQELGYFPTPKHIVARLLELAQIEPGMVVLEPSAGQGAIAEEIAKLGIDVVCGEIDERNAQILVDKGLLPAGEVCCDFLTIPCQPQYDRVVMNPPFAKQQDIAHVVHAFGFLKPGGKLVSVMSAGVEFRTNALTKKFLALLNGSNGTIEKLPANSFAESGTGVNTVIVTLEKVWPG